MVVGQLDLTGKDLEVLVGVGRGGGGRGLEPAEREGIILFIDISY